MSNITLFEVWQEGFHGTGDRGTAYKLGEVEAETFLGACKKLDEQGVFGGSEDSRLKIVEGVPRSWVCRLFDNEQDARKSHG